MQNDVSLEPVDYLLIGHVAHDLTSAGPRLGGTAAYSALTARALGMRVGVVTAAGKETSIEPLQGIPVVLLEAPQSTTFENIYTEHGRVQYLRAQAARIDVNSVPETWRSASIIHLGPIADEIDPVLPKGFSPGLLGITPQGWMRQWDSEGRVSSREWQDSESALARAGAVVISREDVSGNEELIEHMAHQTRLFVVTDAAAGCVLYWNGDRRRFRAPEIREVDVTGAGDIFATAFFVRLHATRDPWAAAHFATLVASQSVKRVGLDGIPTAKEIQDCLVEILL